jgi:hypothetical protein
MKFGKWKLQITHGFVPWIILKWISKKYDVEALILIRTGTDVGAFKKFLCTYEQFTELKIM